MFKSSCILKYLKHHSLLSSGVQGAGSNPWNTLGHLSFLREGALNLSEIPVQTAWMLTAYFMSGHGQNSSEFSGIKGHSLLLSTNTNFFYGVDLN